MLTRSGKEYLQNSNNQKTVMFDVNIDFDEASNAWKLNKKTIGNGCYKYKCIKITKTGKPCNKESLPNINYCRWHINCKYLENNVLHL